MEVPMKTPNATPVRGRRSCTPIPTTRSASGPTLVCPICGNDYVHPISVEVLPPGAVRGVLRVNADGIYLDPWPQPDGRGVRTTLAFLCEAGHTFYYVLHFHKGMTFIKRRVGTTYPDLCHTPETIWRD